MNPAMSSRWQDTTMDLQPGRAPFVYGTDAVVTFELPILGGLMRDELFNPTPRTRLAIKCNRDGVITVRILNGRSSGA